MIIQNMILGGIILFLVFILYKTLNNQKKQNNKTQQFPDKLRLISKKTGQVLEMRLADEDIHSLTEKLNDEAFLLRAQMAFQQIVESFSKGNLSALKKSVEENVYRVFAQQIKLREENKQTLDFSIVCMNSAEITHKSESQDEITVQFVTEQINVLKNESGEAVEGDPMSIAKVKDIWTFRKANKNKWLLSSTQSEAVL